MGYLWEIMILSTTRYLHIHPPMAHRAAQVISTPGELNELCHSSAETQHTPDGLPRNENPNV